MSRHPRRKALLGLFILGGVGIATGAVFALGDIQEAFVDTISVETRFTAVDGLARGDSVWFQGVRVGRVQSVELSPDGGVDVSMALKSEMVDAIPASSVATVSTDGLIGNPIVSLSGGDVDDPRVQDGTELVSEAGVSTEELMASLQENSEKLSVVLDDVTVATDRIANGDGTVGRLIHEDALYDDLSESVATLDRATRDAERVAADLSGSLDTPGTLPHALVNDTETWASVERSAANLEHTTEQTAQVVSRVDQALDRDTPMGVLVSNEEAGTDLAHTVDNLREGSVLLNENLEAMQHNFLLRGFFKKKEKREKKKREAEADRNPADPDDDVDRSENAPDAMADVD